MDLIEAMERRHSVRQYESRRLPEEVVREIRAEIASCNQLGNLNVQLVVDEPRAFDGFLAHYGKFSGVENYIAVVGKKSGDLEERCGYYGQRVVLRIQQLGLNTCWVGLTYSKVKGAFLLGAGEKLVALIAFGYGKTQGVAHKSKDVGRVSSGFDGAPQWFQEGVRAALLAPTSMNQQKFHFSYQEGGVQARPGMGFNTKLDLGIAKYHFELAAGKDNFGWMD